MASKSAPQPTLQDRIAALKMRRDPAVAAAERTGGIALAALGATRASPAGLVPLAGLAAEPMQGLYRCRASVAQGGAPC
jgi:hypothetical protein